MAERMLVLPRDTVQCRLLRTLTFVDFSFDLGEDGGAVANVDVFTQRLM